MTIARAYVATSVGDVMRGANASARRSGGASQETLQRERGEMLMDVALPAVSRCSGE